MTTDAGNPHLRFGREGTDRRAIRGEGRGASHFDPRFARSSGPGNAERGHLDSGKSGECLRRERGRCPRQHRDEQDQPEGGEEMERAG